jgi:hypothetical protein
VENNIKTEIRIWGVVNIIISILCIVFFILPFFTSVLGGWVGDLSIKNSLHKALLYFIGRLSLAIIFIFSFSLLKSGVLIIRLDQRGRRTGIISGLFIIVGSALNFLSNAIDTFFQEGVFFSGINIFGWVFVAILIILILEMFYLDSQSVKSVFNDYAIRIPIRNSAVIISLVYIFPTFWLLINKLFFPR